MGGRETQPKADVRDKQRQYLFKYHTEEQGGKELR